MVKCNMTPEEQRAALELFSAYPIMEKDLERSKVYFQKRIFYDACGRKNYRRYFCPECGWFELTRSRGGYGTYQGDPFSFHHNDMTQCPRCGLEGLLVCLGRAGEMKSLCQWGKLAFFRNAGGTLIISAGEAKRKFCLDDLDPAPEFFPKALYAVEPGKRQMWRRDRWWVSEDSSVRHELHAQKTFTEPFPAMSCWMNGGVVHGHGEVGVVGVESIGETSMRYCAAEQAFRDVYDCSIDDRDWDSEPVRGVIRYLGEYSVRPQLEMLVKLGHLDVVEAVLETGSAGRGLVNWRAKTPAAFFKLSRSEYKALLTVKDNALAALKSWRERRSRTQLALEAFLEIWGKMGDRAEEFFDICEERQARPEKAAAWLQGQNAGWPLVGLWKDYLRMAGRLGRDMSFRRNLYPEDLRAAHDEAAAMTRRMDEQAAEMSEKELREAYIKKRYRRLRKEYEYSDGELSVTAPRSEREIVSEGKTLSHCVGGYARRHMQGKTTILFVRWADDPETPYVTVEISDADHHIIQAHGYRNDVRAAGAPMALHQAFFDEWREWLRRGSPRTPKGDPIRPAQKNMSMEGKTA